MSKLLGKLVKSLEGFYSPLGLKLEWGIGEYTKHLRIDGDKATYCFFTDIEEEFQVVYKKLSLEEAQRLALEVFLSEEKASYRFWTRKEVG